MAVAMVAMITCSVYAMLRVIIEIIIKLSFKGTLSNNTADFPVIQLFNYNLLIIIITTMTSLPSSADVPSHLLC